MKNLPIITKFLTVMAAFGLFSLASTYYATSQMREISASYRQLLDGESTAAIEAARASRNLQTAIASIGDLLMANTDSANQAALAAMTKSQAAFTSFMDEAAVAAPAESGPLLALKVRGLNILNVDCAHTIQLAQAATTIQANAAAQQVFLSECQPDLPGVTADVATEITHLQSGVTQAETNLAEMTRDTVLTVFAVLLTGLAAIIGAAFLIIRRYITAPITGLQQVMDRLAKGNFDTRLTDEVRRDEIGGMAAAVRVFKEAGLEKRRLEAEAASQRAAAEAERQKAEAERQTEAAQQQAVVTALGTGLEHLARGDLQYRVRESFTAAYEKLRADFNDAMEKMHDTMKAIATTTAGVKTGASEINQASDDLSRRTEQQAASLEETAAALDEITATVKRTADGAKQARDLTTAAKSDAERSAEVVREMVGAMDGIETSSKQIGNIIGVIDEIAFQTNLLALNAGVEAARAGDAGRGFAVVATEVRALAQRSAEAAKEIKGLISTSSQQVEGGVKLVGETGKALARIAEQVAQLNELVAAIAASAQEQATGLGEVNTAVNQMDQVTQKNAAMVEQTTAASNALASEAQALAQLIARFQTSAASSSPANPAPPAATRRAPAPPASPHSAPAPRAKTAATSQNTITDLAASTKRAASGGGVAESSQDWSEF